MVEEWRSRGQEIKGKGVFSPKRFKNKFLLNE
jgi:hypothetical protein